MDIELARKSPLPLHPSYIAHLALEQLSLGIVVISNEIDKVRLANRSGRRALEAFGQGTDAFEVPERLRRAIESQGKLFAARSIPIRIADASDWHLEAQRLPDSGDILITMKTMGCGTDRLVERLQTQTGMSARTCEAVALARLGLKNSEIAGRMNLQRGTIKQYLTVAFRRLNVRTRGELVACVMQIELADAA
jgi:DNA-binding CsgD family transcriptional regulator